MTNDEINTTLQKFKNISHNLLFQKKKTLQNYNID